MLTVTYVNFYAKLTHIKENIVADWSDCKIAPPKACLWITNSTGMIHC